MSGRDRGRGTAGRGGPGRSTSDQQSLPSRPRGDYHGQAGQASRSRGTRGDTAGGFRGDGRGGFRGDARGGFRGDSRGGFRGDARGRDRGDTRGKFRGGRGGGGQRETIALFEPDYPAVEDEHVTKRENELLVQSVTNDNASQPLLPARPAYGAVGKPLLVWTNYFHLQIGDLVLFRYEVKVKLGHKDAPRGVAKRIIELLIIDHLRPSQIDAVSDLRATVITRHSLHENLAFEVVYRAEGEDLPEDDAATYEVVLTPTGTLNMSELVDYSTSISASRFLTHNQELIQAMNIVIGYKSRTDPETVTVGRTGRVSKALDQPRVSLGGGLEALRSFVFSARAATERVLINVQVKNLPFLIAVPLPKLLNDFRMAGGTPQSLSPFLRLVSVEVTHIQRRAKSGKIVPRYKTVLGLASKRDGKRLKHPPNMPRDGANAKEVKFWLEEPGSAAGGSSKKGKAKVTEATDQGKYISVFEFFQTRHNITLSEPGLPVLNVGTTSDPSYLPPEVCRVRPGQVAQNKISPQQTAQMIRFAVRQPSANAESITTIGLDLLQLERNDASAFSHVVQPQLLVVPARRLPAPQLIFGKAASDVSNARWDLRSKKMTNGASLSNWACVYVPGGRPAWSEQQELKLCLDKFVKALRDMGIQCASAPDPHWLEQPPSLLPTIQQLAATRPSMILVILPDYNNSSLYNSVKQTCDLQEGVLCQCVIDSKFAKQQAQYFMNVGLKINLKLGGVNQTIPTSNFGSISPGETMFVGLDVTHPSPGSVASAPSVVGIVSSIDSALAQWPAAMRIQESKKEMVSDLSELFKGRLRLWFTKNRTLPKNIILYRDGVSEGQYQTVLDEELPAIRLAINECYSPAEVKQRLPGLAIIIVGKRHHTRFYPAKSEDADERTGNLKNGLVVDRGVTNFANWDFFLQAHTPLHGTAKPAHYYVIYDELFRKMSSGKSEASAADALEKMTHGLCYLFGRATTAVSICPPAYYADLVCERARCYLSDQFAPSASNSMSGSTEASVAGRDIGLHPWIRDKMFYI